MYARLKLKTQPLTIPCYTTRLDISAAIVSSIANVSIETGSLPCAFSSVETELRCIHTGCVAICIALHCGNARRYIRSERTFSLGQPQLTGHAKLIRTLRTKRASVYDINIEYNSSKLPQVGLHHPY